MKKSTANNILTGGKPETHLLRSGTVQGCPHIPLLLNIILEVLVNIISQ